MFACLKLFPPLQTLEFEINKKQLQFLIPDNSDLYFCQKIQKTRYQKRSIPEVPSL